MRAMETRWNKTPCGISEGEGAASTRIRAACPKDAEILALLGRLTFSETFGYLFRDHPDDLRAYLDTTFGVEKIRRSLGKTENAYWLASIRSLPVGYAKLKHPSAVVTSLDVV